MLRSCTHPFLPSLSSLLFFHVSILSSFFSFFLPSLSRCLPVSEYPKQVTRVWRGKLCQREQMPFKWHHNGPKELMNLIFSMNQIHFKDTLSLMKHVANRIYTFSSLVMNMSNATGHESPAILPYGCNFLNMYFQDTITIVTYCGIKYKIAFDKIVSSH